MCFKLLSSEISTLLNFHIASILGIQSDSLHWSKFLVTEEANILIQTRSILNNASIETFKAKIGRLLTTQCNGQHTANRGCCAKSAKTTNCLGERRAR